MKTMLLSASALVLILSAPALAAPHDQGGDPHGGGHDRGGHPAAAAAPAGPAGGAAHGGGGHHGGAGGANILNMSGPSHTPAGNTATPAGNTATPHARGGHGGGHANGAFNPLGAGGRNGGGHDSRTHAGRGHNSAFDALRRAFNAPRHYHYRGGSYHQPSGWRYQRWAIGAFLPSLYWSNSYWIGDYNDYGLDNPPPGTVWVRYGDDALLIDRDSGEVIQVIYGIFY
jgi:Ni/Co efflux regulator RcnB